MILSSPIACVGEVVSAALRSDGFEDVADHGAGLADGVADGIAAVRPEAVHDHDVARTQDRDQSLLDVETEALAVDRAVDEPGCVNAVAAQCGDEDHGLPVALWAEKLTYKKGR